MKLYNLLKTAGSVSYASLKLLIFFFQTVYYTILAAMHIMKRDNNAADLLLSLVIVPKYQFQFLFLHYYKMY